MTAITKDERYGMLLELGIALSAERNHNHLMEKILRGARSVANADGGTLYLMTEARDALRFEIMLNESLGVAVGGDTGQDVPYPPLPLYDDNGKPNHRNVATHCALSGDIVNIADVRTVADFDFSGTRAFDARTGYRSQSFLAVPLRNRQGQVVGVLQLINARAGDGRIVPFDAGVAPLLTTLASHAAVALENAGLLQAQKDLFRSLIHLIAVAIDAKSPYTGGHCERVPELTLALARAACTANEGPFKDFSLDEEEWEDLSIAADLHDCGKITTPEFVIDKATKLETVHNRIHEIRTRFEVLKRDARIEYLEAIPRGDEDDAVLKERYERRLIELDDDFAFIAECNLGSEFMAPSRIERLKRIASTTWVRTIDDRLGLSANELRRCSAAAAPLPVVENLLADQPWHIIPHDAPIDPRKYLAEGITQMPMPHKYNRGEIYNLCVGRGTLTEEDRLVVNEHIIQTILMLRALPFPKTKKRIVEWAGGHHERVDGAGYPRGLTRDAMSVPARIIAIADIFEALTAADRPYKKPKNLSEAMAIMSAMAGQGHIDPDLFRLFLDSRIWSQYADKYLRPEQITPVDVQGLRG
ncbi:MAG: GAF domain-containing protein [Magnetospirillum sp.]|nr:GAF domain-containing protein [Magnetospirillum sp.]